MDTRRQAERTCAGTLCRRRLLRLPETQEYLDFGVDYTFGLPVGRKKWMRMEFNLGVGCIMTKARHYTPTADYEELIKDPGIKNKYYTVFGPTRAGISFVLPIIVKHKAKGGGR